MSKKKTKAADSTTPATSTETPDKPPFGRNKYRAKPTIYNGERYDSKAEARHAETLDAMKRAGHLRWVLRQVPIPIGEPGIDKPYRVDFVVCGSNGQVWAEEVKGVETAAFRRQKRQWAKRGPFPLLVIHGKKRVETIHCETA